MLRSNLLLRDRVHEELAALLSAGGPLAVPSEILVRFLADDVVIAETVCEYRASTNGGVLD